jgi:hypothetical protein
MLCMYTPGWPALPENLIAAGIKVPTIGYPQHMPSGEMQFSDPFANRIVISPWGKEQQEAWEKRIGRKA